MQWTSFLQRYRMRSSIMALLFVIVLGYFCFHALNGERGFFAFIQLSQEVENSRRELEMLRAERLQIEHRVKLLKNESLDLDLLDEQARRVLGQSKPDELLYIVPEENANLPANNAAKK
jgi:cell division protein FtsB